MKKKKGAEKNIKNKVSKSLFWTPRILSIIFILFLALFSLDVFELCNGFFQCTGALFMHNIPVFILVAVLVVSWKRELIGAIAFVLAGLLYILQLLINSSMDGFQWYYLSWSLIIAGPAFVVAFLWYLNWKKKNKR